MPLYDFVCPDGHRTETLRRYVLRDDPLVCSCGLPASRIPVAPHVGPDGVYSYAPNIGDARKFERRWEGAKKNAERVAMRRDGERPPPPKLDESS